LFSVLDYAVIAYITATTGNFQTINCKNWAISTIKYTGSLFIIETGWFSGVLTTSYAFAITHVA